MSDTALSFTTNLTLVGQAYRQTRYRAGDRLAAERAALDTYRSLNPDAPEAEAREAVARIIKASSEAGLIWTQN